MKLGSYEGIAVVQDCLIVTITKGSARNTTCKKATASLYKNPPVKTSTQKLYIQPWAGTTLVINDFGQGLLFQNTFCNTHLFAHKIFPCLDFLICS
jgi:hypothetical protein